MTTAVLAAGESRLGIKELRAELRERFGLPANASMARISRQALLREHVKYGLPVQCERPGKPRHHVLLDWLTVKFRDRNFRWFPERNRGRPGGIVVGYLNYPTIAGERPTLLELAIYPVSVFDKPGAPGVRRNDVQNRRVLPPVYAAN